MESTNTRSQILDIAQNLIQKNGVNAMSYDDISKAISIRKASIHYYFPTKETQREQGLLSLKFMRKSMGDLVANQTDEQLEVIREKLYALAYFVYYDWIDSMKK